MMDQEKWEIQCGYACTGIEDPVPTIKSTREVLKLTLDAFSALNSALPCCIDEMLGYDPVVKIENVLEKLGKG